MVLLCQDGDILGQVTITKDIFICKSSDRISRVTKEVILSWLWIAPINYKNVIPILKVDVLHVTDTVKNVITFHKCN